LHVQVGVFNLLKIVFCKSFIIGKKLISRDSLRKINNLTAVFS